MEQTHWCKLSDSNADTELIWNLAGYCVPFLGANDGMRLQVAGEKTFLSEIPFIGMLWLYKAIVVHWRLLVVISVLVKSANSAPEKCCGVQGLSLTLPWTCTASTHKMLQLTVSQDHPLLNKGKSTHLPREVFWDPSWYHSLLNGH